MSMGTEKNLLQNHEIYNNLPCAYFSEDANGIITECNSLFLKLTGYKEEEVIGVKSIQNFLSLGGKIYYETHYTPLLRMQGMVKEVSLDLVRKDGVKFPILMNSTEIKDANGSIQFVQSTFFDISQRKSYELELLNAKRHGEEMVSQLLILNDELKTKSLDVEEKKEGLAKINRNLLKKNKELTILGNKSKLLIESSKAIMSTHDLKGNMLSANLDSKTTLGYTNEEILKFNLIDFISKKHKFRVQSYLRLIKKTGSLNGEISILCKNGSIKNLAYSATLATDSKGGNFVITNVIDITKRYQAEKELNRSNELLNQINKVARIGGWEFEIPTNEFYCSSVTKELMGVSADYKSRIEEDINLYKEGMYRDMVKSALHEAVTKGTPFDLEVIMINHKGREFWSRVMCEVEMKKGKPVRLIGTFQDVDEKKKMKIEANKTKVLLENILSSAKDVGIIVTDDNHIVRVFNKGAENLFGYTAEEIVGIHSPGRFHLEEEVIARGKELEKLFGKKLNPNEIVPMYASLGREDSHEWLYVKKDGTIITVQLMFSELKDHEDKHIGYMAVVVDVSDLKSAKSSLETLSNDLQKKNHQLLDFAQITSHNLRSPVANLISLVTLYNESDNIKDKNFLFVQLGKVVNNLSETLNDLIKTLQVQEDTNKEDEWLSFSTIFNKTKETLAGHILENEVLITSDFSEIDKIKYPKSSITVKK